MSELEDSELYLLIPASKIDNVACFVIYDEHPMDKKHIDITICSKQGEVAEYYKKSLISSTIIRFATDFRRISILRSSNCDLYYLVEAHEEIIILSRKDDECLSIIKPRLRFVKSYELCDLKCTGEVSLKIITEHTTKYYSIDNGFKNIDVINENTNSNSISSSLRNKLKEATDNLERNKKAYDQILNLRQRAAHFMPKPDDLKILQQHVQFFNKNIVILLEVNQISMEKVCVLIHNNSSNSISYSTKYMNRDEIRRFNDSQIFGETDDLQRFSTSQTLIAAVIPLKEFKSSVISKIEFNLVVSYQRNGNDYLTPCKAVYVSASDVMRKNFDVFNSSIDNLWKTCTILSSTEKTTLCFQQISLDDKIIAENPLKMFIDYLQFALLYEFGATKIAVHKLSPNHILYGVMIVSYDNTGVLMNQSSHEFNFTIDVYTRSPSQVLALVHFINDTVPHNLIVTTPNISLTPILEIEDEEMEE